MSRTGEHSTVAGLPPPAPRLLNAHRPRLVDHVTLHLPSTQRPRTDADDNIQAVFLRAVQHFDRFSAIDPDAVFALLAPRSAAVITRISRQTRSGLTTP